MLMVYPLSTWGDRKCPFDPGQKRSVHVRADLRLARTVHAAAYCALKVKSAAPNPKRITRRLMRPPGPGISVSNV